MKLGWVLIALLTLSYLPPLTAQQSPEAEAVMNSALRDARALHPGMTRADVEKTFENASFVVPSPTKYTWRKLPIIHIEVSYRVKKDAEGRSLQPG
jgi:hypothetical protein